MVYFYTSHDFVSEFLKLDLNWISGLSKLFFFKQISHQIDSFNSKIYKQPTIRSNAFNVGNVHDEQNPKRAQNHVHVSKLKDRLFINLCAVFLKIF
jgi:hypothetical protein